MEPYNINRTGYIKVLSNVQDVDGDGITPNPHSFRLYERKATGYVQSRKVGSGEIAHDNLKSFVTLPALGLSTSTYLATDRNQLEAKVQEKVYEQLRSANAVVVDFAERSSTIKMVKDALNIKKFVREFMSDVVRGRPGKKLDYIAGKWLEYRYGWTPLAHSLYDAAENLRKEALTKPFLVQARAGRRREVHETHNKRSTGYDHISVWLSERLEVGYMFNLNPYGRGHPATWTSLNPLLIAWELVPLSFVADWFVNVGDQLAAWENHVLFSSNFLSGYRTYTLKEDRLGTQIFNDMVPVEFYSNGNPKRNFWGSSYTARETGSFKELTRSRVLSLPAPVGLSFKIDLNANRVADAAALTKKLLLK